MEQRRMTLHDTQLSLADVEREHILDTLAQCGGNRTHTAKILKISVRSLRMKLQNYSLSGIDVLPPPNGSDANVARIE
jgi:DNA-binding NtrC family response regulator